MIALVTIGQSPRTDILASMFNVSSADWLLESGALDGLSREEIAELAPVHDDHPLVTRLVSGEEVVIAKRTVLPLLQDAVRRVETAGPDVICVLCTGEFPSLTSRARLIFPDRILFHTVEAILPAGRLGVLMPHEGQRAMMERKWTTATRSVACASASPYDPGSSFADAAQRLVDAGAELIVMDCMGFDRRMLSEVRSVAKVPVILANSLVGAVLREMSGSLELAEIAGRV